MKIVQSRTSRVIHIGLIFLSVGLIAASGFIGWKLMQRSALAMGDAPAGKIWSLVLSEEFNGTSLNQAQWKPYHNTYGDGNLEEACLTPNNVTVGGGVMKITAKRENVACPNAAVDKFTSGFIDTRGKNIYYPAFGRYEMRAKLPHGQGLWPAFWLRHKSGAGVAEVDIMEYFHATNPGKTSQTLHFPAEIGSNVMKVAKTFETPTASPQWHTWSVEIIPTDQSQTKAKFIFYQDGVKTQEYTPSKFGWLNNYNKDAMFDVAINLAVGGKYVGHPDDELAYSSYLSRCLKPYGAARPCNATGVRRASFPSAYEVDYVRVYALKNAPTSTPTPTPTPTTPTTPPQTGGGGSGGSTGSTPTNPTTPTKPDTQQPSPTTPSTNGGKSSSSTSSNTVTPYSSNTGQRLVADQKKVTSVIQAPAKRESVELSPTINTPRVSNSISKVEYYIDGKLAQTDSVAPFEFNAAILVKSAKVTQRVYYKNGDYKDTTHMVEVESRSADRLQSAVISALGLIATNGVATIGYVVARHRHIF